MASGWSSAQIKQICREEMQADLASLQATISDLKSQLVELQGRSQETSSTKDPQDALTKRELKAYSEGLEGYQPVGENELMSDELLMGETTEYAQILRHATHEHDLVPDVWSTATLVIVKDFADIQEGNVSLEIALRMTMVTLCLVGMLLLQVYLLYFIGIYVVLPNVAAVQNVYSDFHQTAFHGGKFSMEGFQSFDAEKRGELCDLAMSRSFFMWICLFLWVAKCLHEMRKNARQAKAINALPALPLGVPRMNMAYEIMDASAKAAGFAKERKVMLVCLNKTSRFLLYLFIFIPRGIFALSLLVMGTAFLTSTRDDSELILNSLAMAFVYDIDELFMECFLPERLAKNIEVTKIVSPSEEDDISHSGMSAKSFDRARVKKDYFHSLAAIVSVILFLWLWFKMQFIIPGYSWDVDAACSTFLDNQWHIPCKPWDKDCFPT